MDCRGCQKSIKHNNYLTCHMCAGNFHGECLNMKPEQCQALSQEYRATWACPVCVNVTRRKGSNLNTPIRRAHVPSIESITDNMDMSCEILDGAGSSSSDKFNLLLDTLNQWRTEINSNISGMRDDMNASLSEIKSEIKSLRYEHTMLKKTVNSLDAELKSLKDAVQFQAEEHNSLAVRVDEVTSSTNQGTNSAVSYLESKIDTLEQQARQCNLEICNIPERRNENLLGIVEAISSAIKFQLSPRDVILVHRVQHGHQGSDRPKNIIVKFQTRILRDNFLSAFRKIKQLKTDRIGMPGSPTLIFANEHLTLKRKQLFRKCRDIARENQYKYVWVKNSTILMREQDDSPAMAIRSEDDLNKILSRKKLREQT